jgi:hypothetical protein
MSNIYEIIGSFLDKEETKKLQIHLINNSEKVKSLLLALESHEKPEVKQSLLKGFLNTISGMLSNNFTKYLPLLIVRDANNLFFLIILTQFR